MTVAPEQTTDTDVLVTTDGPVGIVTINRPHRLNAVTPEAGDRLAAAFTALEADPQIRAVVLTGAGRGFCAGADISGDVGNARTVLLDTWNPLVQKMVGLEIPITAGLNGVAAAAGVSLALTCDLRVAAASSRIQLSFTKIGLLPDAGLIWLLPRIVGLGRANELAPLARDVHAPTAITLGHEVAALAGSVTAVKRAHRRSFDATLTEQLTFEADPQGWLQQQPDFAESTTAFSEKRPPVRVARTPGHHP